MMCLLPCTRANALQEYDTLEVPYLHLAKSIKLWKPTELHDLPIQVLAVPWVPKSMMIAAFDTRRMTSDEIHQQLEFEISKRIETAIGRNRSTDSGCSAGPLFSPWCRISQSPGSLTWQGSNPFLAVGKKSLFFLYRLGHFINTRSE
jgi:hypothetical protein